MCHVGGRAGLRRRRATCTCRWVTTPTRSSPSGYSPHRRAGPGRELLRRPAHLRQHQRSARQDPAHQTEPDGTYTIPAGNLLDRGKGRPEIYVMGNRNPFRIAVDRARGWLYWGEVGPDACDDCDSLDTRGPRGYDEFNQAKQPATSAGPTASPTTSPTSRFDFATKQTSGAQASTARPRSTTRPTTPAQRPCRPHSPPGSPTATARVISGLGTAGGRTAVMGAVYRWQPGGCTNKLPRHYDGSMFLMDYSRGWINEVTAPTRRAVIQSVEPFLPAPRWNGLISMRISPSGVMYVAQYGTGSTVYRVNYSAATTGRRWRSPRPTWTRVRLRSRSRSRAPGSADPEAEPLTFAWDFQGDGTRRLDRAESVLHLRGGGLVQREAHGQRRPGHERRPLRRA